MDMYLSVIRIIGCEPQIIFESRETNESLNLNFASVSCPWTVVISDAVIANIGLNLLVDFTAQIQYLSAVQQNTLYKIQKSAALWTRIFHLYVVHNTM